MLSYSVHPGLLVSYIICIFLLWVQHGLTVTPVENPLANGPVLFIDQTGQNVHRAKSSLARGGPQSALSPLSELSVHRSLVRWSCENTHEMLRPFCVTFIYARGAKEPWQTIMKGLTKESSYHNSISLSQSSTTLGNARGLTQSRVQT